MSLIFCDSADHILTDTEIANKWGATSVIPSTLVGSRFGSGFDGRLILLDSIIGPDLVRFNYPNSISSGVIGFAFKKNGEHAGYRDGDREILDLRKGSNRQLAFRVEQPTFAITCYRGSTFLGRGNLFMEPDAWHYVEFKYHVSSSIPESGVVVYIDGEVDLVLAQGTNTQNQVDNVVDNFQIDNIVVSSLDEMFVDDVYFIDHTGSKNTSHFGSVIVRTLRPNGTGVSQEWLGSDGDSIDNYLLVDDTTPDNDTTTVRADSAGLRDIYSHTDVIDSGNVNKIYGIQIISYAKKSGATTQLQNTAHVSGINFDQGPKTLGTSYDFVLSPMDENPVTSGFWVPQELNEAQFGVLSA